VLAYHSPAIIASRVAATRRTSVSITEVDPLSWTLQNPNGREAFTMPRTHKPYPLEFRQRMVELVRAGRDPAELAKEFEPSEWSIRGWVKQAGIDLGERSDGLTTEEREELRRLRRENKILREEREILKKAAAWFARETGSIPPKGSDS
jgi:transposase